MKSRNIYFGPEIDELMRQVGAGQVSSTIRNLVRGYVSTARDRGQIDIEIIQKEREDLEQKKQEIAQELEIREQQIKDHEQQKRQFELEELQKKQAEAKEEEAQSCCQNCGTNQAPKWHEFKIGWICSACYQGGTAKEFGKWMRGGTQ